MGVRGLTIKEGKGAEVIAGDLTRLGQMAWRIEQLIDQSNDKVVRHLNDCFSFHSGRRRLFPVEYRH